MNEPIFPRMQAAASSGTRAAAIRASSKSSILSSPKVLRHQPSETWARQQEAMQRTADRPYA